MISAVNNPEKSSEKNMIAKAVRRNRKDENQKNIQEEEKAGKTVFSVPEPKKVPEDKTEPEEEETTAASLFEKGESFTTIRDFSEYASGRSSKIMIEHAEEWMQMLEENGRGDVNRKIKIINRIFQNLPENKTYDKPVRV